MVHRRCANHGLIRHKGEDLQQMRSSAALAIIGFVIVACAFSTNTILARANAGEVPSFSLAFFRWMTVALALALFSVREIKEKWPAISPRLGMVAVAGFCGMFLCGGPVYVAGITTTAINIGLIMAAAPVNVLLIAWIIGSEKIRPVQVASIALALPGVALILARGSLDTLTTVNFASGDILVFIAMLGWTGYNLLQVRTLPDVSSIPRTCLYAFAGAGFSLPFCLYEAWVAPQAVFSARAFLTYLFAAIVPGIGAYAGLAYLAAKFGSVRASLMTYVVPIASVLLSMLFLGEGPSAYHFIGGLLILAGIWLSVRR
jgi:drug/metabolite transporter (DMT)-like permease